MQIAKTILDQLGGRRFMVMTGAKDFVGGERSLSFSLPAKLTRHKINKVRITLEHSDLYTLEAFRLSGHAAKIKPLGTVGDVYADGLTAAFTRLTGLETKL